MANNILASCIDIGTHSIKVYTVDSNNLVHKILTKTWELIENEIIPEDVINDITYISEYVTNLDDTLPSYKIFAIATEGIRRNPYIGKLCTDTLALYNIELKIISQVDEANLIRSACRSDTKSENITIIDAGGGSIQLILPDKIILFPFGISDLNLRFYLNAENPLQRDIHGALEFLTEQFPDNIGNFIYTGGEASYIQAMNVPIDNGWVKSSDFIDFANQLAAKKLSDFNKLSPFDIKWMSGAVASNCIVTSLLAKSDQEGFLASDISISHAIIAEVVKNITTITMGSCHNTDENLYEL
jgi:hypothetical protein